MLNAIMAYKNQELESHLLTISYTNGAYSPIVEAVQTGQIKKHTQVMYALIMWIHLQTSPTKLVCLKAENSRGILNRKKI